MESNMEVTGLITPLVNAYKLLSNEWKHLMDIGIAEYLDSQTEKFYNTNTFLHRGEKHRFYDVYYPVKAYYKAMTTDFSDSEEIFKDYKNITIIGSAGSGKSTLIKYIFLETIKKKNRIPILIELRNLNDYQGDLEKLIVDKILKSSIKPSDNTLKRALESGRFLFLLDGYDEIFSSRKEELKRQIESFVDSYHNNSFLMSTRPGGGIESFPRFCNFRIWPLKNRDIEAFIDKMVNNAERKDRIKKVIQDNVNKNYVHYLGNPLLLSMFILAFESHPEIPIRKSAFYRNVFDTLYAKHDGITKNSFNRERLTKLQREDFEDLLSKFSYVTLSKGQYAFTYELLTDTLQKIKSSTQQQFIIEDLIADLQTSISILLLDGFEYKFLHRSMQEFFAARFISNLPPQKKSKAFDKLHSFLVQSGTNGSFEFWDLCLEQDPYNFISCFVLPNLKGYALTLNVEADHQLITAFALLGGLKIDHGASGKDYITFFFKESLFLALMKYYNIVEFEEVSSFPRISNSADDFKILIQKLGGKWLTVNEEGLHPELLGMLMEYNFAQNLKKYQIKLNAMIAALEADISRKENDIDDLLDLD